MFKGLANLGALLKQAQQIGGQMSKLTDELKGRRTTGTAGGGMVEIEVNGLLEVLHCGFLGVAAIGFQAGRSEGGGLAQ